MLGYLGPSRNKIVADGRILFNLLLQSFFGMKVDNDVQPGLNSKSNGRIQSLKAKRLKFFGTLERPAQILRVKRDPNMIKAMGFDHGHVSLGDGLTTFVGEPVTQINPL